MENKALDKLPAPFRKTVDAYLEREPSWRYVTEGSVGEPSSYLSALIYAWDKCSRSQKRESEPAVIEAVVDLLENAKREDARAYFYGIFAASLDDVSLPSREEWVKGREGEFLLGLREGGGIRINDHLYDLLDKVLNLM